MRLKKPIKPSKLKKARNQENPKKRVNPGHRDDVKATGEDRVIDEGTKKIKTSLMNQLKFQSNQPRELLAASRLRRIKSFHE